MKVKYRDFIIEYDPKPIPISCGVDWNILHKDYDPDSGGIDGEFRFAADEQDARDEIDSIYEEHEA